MKLSPIPSQYAARLQDFIDEYIHSMIKLTQLTGFKLTRGALCAMKRPILPDPQTVCRGARRIVILENVMNPTNVGVIFRNAAALNIDAVLSNYTFGNQMQDHHPHIIISKPFQLRNCDNLLHLH